MPCSATLDQNGAARPGLLDQPAVLPVHRVFIGHAEQVGASRKQVFGELYLLVLDQQIGNLRGETVIPAQNAGWTASTNTSGNAAAAIDGNPGTRFTSGADQTAGMNWELNLGAHQGHIDSAKHHQLVVDRRVPGLQLPAVAASPGLPALVWVWARVKDAAGSNN